MNIGIIATVVDSHGDLYVAILARQSPGEKIHYFQSPKKDEPVHFLRERLNGVFPGKGFCSMAHAAGCEPQALSLPKGFRITVDGTIADYVHVHTTLEHWLATFDISTLPRHKLVCAGVAQVRCPTENRAIKAALHRIRASVSKAA